MKNVIIGTAGHVDHGKTALIMALTGIDTDRLAEEKRRGITIELGFAYLDFDDGTRAGIVDVPGHERFIRNMLAGAGGIDLAMLIVAADEGIMPQTAEHLGILSILGVKSGLVAITKSDLVEQEWLDMVTADVEELVSGSFLEGQPIVPVSAYSGANLDTLRQELRRLIDGVSEKNVRIPFRLPVDRIFSMEGFGAVVTGTLIEGVVNVGDAAEVLPARLPATVRNIQVHGRSVHSAGAGQRVALNLSGIKKSDIEKGNVVAKRDTVRTAAMLDVKLQVLPESKRTIKNASQLHLYHGTRVLLAKAVLLDRDELLPGQSCYAQLRLTELLPSKTGDRFVVRFLSPLETIGGGVILDPDPPKRKRSDPDALDALKIRESGSTDQHIYQAAVKEGRTVPSDALRRALDMTEEEFRLELEPLTGAGRLIELLPGKLIADAVLDALSESCRTLLASYHKEHPLHAGLRVAELRQKLLGKEETAVANAVMNELCREGSIRFENGRVSLAAFEVRLTKRQRAIREKILDVYRAAGYESPPPEEIPGLFGPGDKNDVRQVTESLLSSGELVMLTPQIYWHRDTFEKARASAEAHFKTNAELTMPQYRDLLGTSRKYALAMLDYLDSARVTKKAGDIRTIFRGFGAL
ncbi:selenocysteine-specific elongation factor [Sporobacter termitidis DSM 10068]|uniref:Selenocysteine-specific elongation factor n=1 Tax=Sporobacter termitidis DSM 10068 TaxID=1123282 RepID=A0A1M5UAZ2_9FIRM|nr:selenocysteine-specific translation elongation factor [Sporobacter termitidis]SHH60205.1 selenocysteine-specific elongation factor [Sporobacter termitidis DSM 10068]